MNFYIGTYTSGKSNGIYKADYNNGLLANPKEYFHIENPKYLKWAHHCVFSVFESDLGAGMMAIKDGALLDQLVYDRVAPCHIAVDGPYLYTANYHEGTVAKLLYRDHKLHYIKEVVINEGAGAHQVIIYNDRLLVPCLKLNKVIIFNKDLIQIGQIELPFNTGPRHGLIFDEHFYLLSEVSNELYIFDIIENEFFVKKTIKLTTNREAFASGICVDEENRRLFISVRGIDKIFVIDIDHRNIINSYDCNGQHPRFITFDQATSTLIVCNRESGNVSTMKYQNNELVVTSNILVADAIVVGW